jgi:hypothetical protein
MSQSLVMDAFEKYQLHEIRYYTSWLASEHVSNWRHCILNNDLFQVVQDDFGTCWRTLHRCKETQWANDYYDYMKKALMAIRTFIVQLQTMLRALFRGDVSTYFDDKGQIPNTRPVLNVDKLVSLFSLASMEEKKEYKHAETLGKFFQHYNYAPQLLESCIHDVGINLVIAHHRRTMDAKDFKIFSQFASFDVEKAKDIFESKIATLVDRHINNVKEQLDFFVSLDFFCTFPTL